MHKSERIKGESSICASLRDTIRLITHISGSTSAISSVSSPKTCLAALYYSL